MRNKELIAEMQKEIMVLKERTCKLEAVVSWFENHDRNDVDFGCVTYPFLPCRTIHYFYNGEIKIAELRECSVNFLPQLVKNGERTIIVWDKCRDKYYQIDKATATVTEIPKPELVDDKIDKKREIEVRLNELLGMIYNIGAIVEFTNLYGADSIIFRNWHDGTKVEYLYNNAKHCVRYNFDYHTDKLPICVKNGDIAILECSGKYYQLDKGKGTIVEIPKPAFVVEKKKSSKKAKK